MLGFPQSVDGGFSSDPDNFGGPAAIERKNKPESSHNRSFHLWYEVKMLRSSAEKLAIMPKTPKRHAEAIEQSVWIEAFVVHFRVLYMFLDKDTSTSTERDDYRAEDFPFEDMQEMKAIAKDGKYNDYRHDRLCL